MTRVAVTYLLGLRIRRSVLHSNQFATSTYYVSRSFSQEGTAAKTSGNSSKPTTNDNNEKIQSRPESASTSDIITLPATPESSLTIFLQRSQKILEESSGLTELAHLKQAVQTSSVAFDDATQQVAECRNQVNQAQKLHEQAHKKHVSLLMRRDEWSGDDAQSFVTITSEEVTTRQALLDAQESLRRAEDWAVKCQHDYMDVMRKRYHEEQMWQEKWRLFGTYGTWSLIGINTIVFLSGQYRTDQREMKRLRHMEELLLKSQELSKASLEESTRRRNIETQGEEVMDATNEEPTSSTDGSDEKSSQDGTNMEDTTREPDNRISKFVREMKIDSQSFAVGALVSASCVIVVSLITSR